MLLKASKYGEAAELAEKWLECEENAFLEHKYFHITECYVKDILYPQGLFAKIQQFLKTNEVLTPEQREVRATYSCVISIGNSTFYKGISYEYHNKY